ncbi:MAG: Threonylcarbamoyl-AMP synthase [Alphaproteobacteria bacterium MarineAlpha5_Bin11]|nr:threonylcarbamoyl-AMP synthase [Pelagibacteraceae bacterium]PPR43765.1 MAG: Threonylcarbamoyl-AMP synthase [Alphaproteobacteria bacterium MarineAlpha5_Bin11]PPR51334.1 MAG: Threonylcarbamoyl-AMP synthase [Alphaproteobacteria bacterium MarineAlpha5_Bin10]|tara:strand:- start:15070 stop:15993 length:924 start_codon:yes stop_codon:yes gene_type:complete
MQIKKGVSVLKNGKLVAFPTETVYGLGTDAENDDAVLKIFEMKNRPMFNPLICHFKDIDAVRQQAVFNKDAEKLAAKLWPGPLTIVMNKNKKCTVSNIASSGLRTIACRIPSNPIARDLLEKFNGIIAAPSANISSRLTATSKKHVVKNFGKKIFIIDGGTSEFGIESTVVDLSQETPRILRPGAIENKIIKEILPNLIENDDNNMPIKSPGQLYKHYSPNIPLRLNVKDVKKNEVLLNFGKNNLKSRIKEINLSINSDLREAAKNLFKFLYELDNKKYSGIAIAPIDNKGMGIAINDRLKRAAFTE